MTSSMFAPVDSEAVSGGDPRNTASSVGHQEHHNRVGGGVLAVDSLIASTTTTNAPSALGSSGLSRYEAECTSGLVLPSSVQHQPRSRAQQHSQHQQQLNNGNSSNHTSNGNSSSSKRRSEEDNYSQRLGVNCPTPYTASEMQPATQFYLNFNPAFAHHGQFGPPSFSTPYMPHYPIASSLNPYNNHLQQQQQQQQQHHQPQLPTNRWALVVQGWG